MCLVMSFLVRGGGGFNEYTSPENFYAWDSLSDVSLILALEGKFNLRFGRVRFYA